jgi:hypothetical protein
MIFVSLSQTDKRVIFFLFLSLIIILALLAYIGFIIRSLMRFQGKRIDSLTHDVLVTKVVNNKKHFVKYANKKSWVLFFKQTYISLIIIITGILVLVIRNVVTNDFAYNVFDHQKTGFSTLLFLWDFENPANYTQVFGITVLANWPSLLNTPHFEAEAWASYIFFPCVVVGGIWYLISLQAQLARLIRISQLKRSLFEKNLDNVNLVNTPIDNN